MLTSYAEVLETVTGQRIEFDSISVQARPAVQPILSASQSESVDAKISKLLAKWVIRISGNEPGEFIFVSRDFIATSFNGEIKSEN